jgi:N-acetylglutamate synthase-like GNAT family acetyltransferase
VTLHAADRGERERVRAFYLACGHTGPLDPADRVLLAEADGEIVGAVRLCVEERVQVLRTMRVRPDFQRRGVGRALLRRFVTMLDGGRDCFCIPYAHLDVFYGEAGFEVVSPDALPPHLAARLAAYQAERPQRPVIAMRRRP